MPNSFLWLGLVALSLFVLVPMMVNTREPVFRAGDRAFATRVLHYGGARPRTESAAAAAPITSGAMQAHIELNTNPGEDRMAMRDTSSHGGAAAGPSEEELARRRGRGGFDPEADALASAARYRLRQRIVVGLAATVVLSAVIALIVVSAAWYLTIASIIALGGYLMYLRTQVRIEQDIRERRMARLRGERSLRDPRAAGGDPNGLDPRDAEYVAFDDEDPEFDPVGDYDEPGYQYHPGQAR
ncbi:gephyrin-like molybdotransferase receptor GlpR [Lolliginicoccus levis]|uniref:gephyrin-like molybdotransferase receptor GlpR n=1 Tax=Lolliginicoccus levis TaxID=2919542 RepID=UPI00242032F7|nr:gephyrin-like molybdotransferase receptor GlpR [Lolliginicoccus levis]